VPLWKVLFLFLIIFLNGFSLLRWKDLLKYLQPLKEYLLEFGKVEFVIRKQQYLEALTWQSVVDSPSGIVPWRPFRHSSEYTTSESEQGKVDMELVVQTLKSLEPLCSQRVQSFSLQIPPPLIAHLLLSFPLLYVHLIRNSINYVIVSPMRHSLKHLIMPLGLFLVED
jgi:hypothetical protein